MKKYSQHPFPHRCRICQRMTTNFPHWHHSPWACRPCMNSYVAFRRAFKAEHSRYPTLAEYLKNDDKQPPTPENP